MESKIEQNPECFPVSSTWIVLSEFSFIDFTTTGTALPINLSLIYDLSMGSRIDSSRVSSSELICAFSAVKSITLYFSFLLMYKTLHSIVSPIRRVGSLTCSTYVKLRCVAIPDLSSTMKWVSFLLFITPRTRWPTRRDLPSDYLLFSDYWRTLGLAVFLLFLTEAGLIKSDEFCKSGV